MEEPERGSYVRSIGWGLFLASSWTWCIGAFLPLLLLRDWGWKGFVVFAVPNVIGATAVGFLWTRDRSMAFTARRRALLAWFSLATIAFQSFFLAWVAPALVAATLGATSRGAPHDGPLAGLAALTALDPDPRGQWTAWFIAMVVFALVVGGARGGRGADRAWIALGTIVTLGSYALWMRHGFGSQSIANTGVAPSRDLWLLAPAIALGFLVCPHLDLSFHRVLQRDGTRTPWLIFAPAFAAMLLFAASGVGGITGAFAAWWFIQVALTAAIHARELRACSMPLAAMLVPAAVLIGAIAGRPGFGDESIYLRFLGLYGAVFPAVALLGWRGWSGLSMLGFLAIAIPAFELGFVGPDGLGGDRWAWAPLIPIVLLLGMLAIPRKLEQSENSPPLRTE